MAEHRTSKDTQSITNTTWVTRIRPILLRLLTLFAVGCDVSTSGSVCSKVYGEGDEFWYIYNSAK